jgi:hypothetical protein
MSTIFTDILKKISKSRRDLGDHKKRTFSWFRTQGAAVRKATRAVDPEKLNAKDIMTSNPERLSKRKVFVKSMLGQICCFYYDAKGKKTLPYWDAFPCVMPIELMEDGRLLALNFHYVPQTSRAILMDKLYSLLEDEPDEGKRIGATYAILKSASKYKLFKPCLKSYLISNIRSRFMMVEPKNWDIILQLPLADWRNGTETQVYQDAFDSIRDKK